MKRMKSLWALAALSFLSTAVQAGWETNFLVGFSGGYAATNGDVNITVFNPAPLFVVNSFNRNIDDDGFIGGIFGGYQARCNGWLFGGELAIDWEDTEADRPFATTIIDSTGAAVGFTGSAHYDRDIIVGLTGRAGYELSQYIMFYLRAGAEWSRDKLFVSAASADNEFGASLDGRRTLTRFLAGIGFEIPVPIFEGLSFRAEYNYHTRGKTVEASTVVINATGAPVSVFADANPHTNSVKLSLVWNFI